MTYKQCSTLIHRIWSRLLTNQGAYKLAWETASTPLKGELMHAWFVKTESEALQLPQYFNVPLELTMSQWMSVRKKWDGMIAKRASEGKSLAPSSAKAYQAFLDAPYRKIVVDTKNKCYIPRPSSATSAIMQNCLILELKMNLDPGHLSLRFGTGPFYHLFVRQFEVGDTEARVKKQHWNLFILKIFGGSHQLRRGSQLVPKNMTVLHILCNVCNLLFALFLNHFHLWASWVSQT